MGTLKSFLDPQSIAFVGVSLKPGGVSSLALETLQRSGFKGDIYLVNFRGGELFGLQVYRNLLDIDGHVDLAIFYLPPAAVVENIEFCGRKEIRSVIVVTDGMEQLTEDGGTYTTQMLQTAEKYGIRIMGPDSLGIINTHKDLNTSFIPFQRLSAGGLSLVAQTGLFAGAGLLWLTSVQGISISKSIDLAKKCDINELECLEYLLEDETTMVIGMHMEEVTHGKRFLEIARRTSLKKPLIIIKAGRTEAAARAIASHTGSFAGRDECYAAAFSQSGVIRTDSVEGLADLAKAFIHLPPVKGNKIGIVTFSGAWGALATDLCDEFGLSIAEFSQDTIKVVREIIPSWRKIVNPADLWPPKKLNITESYKAIISAMAEDDGVDALLVLGPAVLSPPLDVLDGIMEEVQKYGEKPVVAWLVGDSAGMKKASSMIENHFLVYPTIKRAVSVLSAKYRYYQFLKSFS